MPMQIECCVGLIVCTDTASPSPLPCYRSGRRCAVRRVELLCKFVFSPAFRNGVDMMNACATWTQDYLPDRLGSETHDDGGGQGATAVQEQLPLLQDHGGDGRLPGFLSRAIREPHQGDGDVGFAGDVRRGPSSHGDALR